MCSRALDYVLLINANASESEGVHYKCKFAILFTRLNWSTRTSRRHRIILINKLLLLSFADCHLNFLDRTLSLCVVATADKINLCGFFLEGRQTYVCAVHTIFRAKRRRHASENVLFSQTRVEGFFIIRRSVFMWA